MGDPLPEDEDQRLEILFRAATGPVADDGFTAAVMGRVARRVWRRRLVVATAGAAGVLVASQPIWNLSLALSRELALVAGRWVELGWALQNPLVLAAGVLLIGAPAALRWLEE
jgi:hypothetical protein